MSRLTFVFALLGLLGIVGITACGTGESDRTPTEAGAANFVLTNVALEMQQQQVKFSFEEKDASDGDDATGDDTSTDGSGGDGTEQTCTDQECIDADPSLPWCYAQDGYCVECLNNTHCPTNFECNAVFECELTI